MKPTSSLINAVRLLTHPPNHRQLIIVALLTGVTIDAAAP